VARSRPIRQVDVFATRPYRGNPVAVVLDGELISERAMQRFAQWMNLSETTFVCASLSAAGDSTYGRGRLDDSLRSMPRE
jgi:PhzF family phenazine biosynthesis protein